MTIKQAIEKLVKFIPVAGSDVVSWNNLTDLNQSHEKGELALVPVFIKDEKAELIFYKRGSKLALGNERIKSYFGSDALDELVTDLLCNANQDENQAIELCKSSEWWEDV